DDAGGRFAIDASTGVVTVANASLLDYETATSHNITVHAADASGAFTAQTFTIAVTDVAPSVTSGASASTPENVSTATAVYTTTATDPDAGTTLVYSISGGLDAALFNINSSTGAVTFKVSPDFEAPTDNGGNNVYDIIVKA